MADQDNARPAKRVKPSPQPRQNTAVYVTGLPLDATVEEVHELFSKKAGVIAEEIDSGKPRIKMYQGADGSFKGDALIVFFKPQSVEMAVMLLDDAEFRFSDTGTSSGKMRVQAADSSYKKTTYDQEAGADGEGANKEKTEKTDRAQRDRDRQKIIKKTQKLELKLADWDDDEPYPAKSEAKQPKQAKTVVLRHMFTLKELDDDPEALMDIKLDVREESEKLGEVTSVVLYDQEPDGVISVRFREADAAQACIKLMDGRKFDGRVVEARLANRKEKFKRSTAADAGEEDSD